MGEEGQRVGAAALSRWEGIHRIRMGLLDSDATARRLEMPGNGRKVEVPALA